MDYGMTVNCCSNDIYEFRKNSEYLNTPPRCYECSLAEIQPSAFHSISNSWDDKTIDVFRSLTINRPNLRETSIDVSFHIFIRNHFDLKSNLLLKTIIIVIIIAGIFVGK